MREGKHNRHHHSSWMANIFIRILALTGSALIMIGVSGSACFLCLRPSLSIS